MTEEEARRLWLRACKIAKRYKADIAEDVAQEVVLKALQDTNRAQRIEHAVIDALRKLRGRKDSQGYCTRINRDEEYMELDHKLAINPDPTFNDFQRKLSSLDLRDRAICILICVWGFTYEEIAHCLGNSVPTIVERIKCIRRMKI